LPDKIKVLGFKVRRKSDGKYMKKGRYSWPNAFGPRGSVFSGRGHAINSIKSKSGPKEFIMDLEIVELVEGNSYSPAWILDKLL
jgi:hypothetical protein